MNEMNEENDPHEGSSVSIGEPVFSALFSLKTGIEISSICIFPIKL